MLTDEQIVHQYFRLIGEKNISGALELFAEDAIVFEPFSNLSGLQGKYAISHFLKVAAMANSGMRRTIRLVESSLDSITAIVTFERGDSVKGRFTFNFITSNDVLSLARKIQTLRIQFI